MKIYCSELEEVFAFEVRDGMVHLVTTCGRPHPLCHDGKLYGSVIGCLNGLEINEKSVMEWFIQYLKVQYEIELDYETVCEYYKAAGLSPPAHWEGEEREKLETLKISEIKELDDLLWAMEGEAKCLEFLPFESYPNFDPDDHTEYPSEVISYDKKRVLLVWDDAGPTLVSKEEFIEEYFL